MMQSSSRNTSLPPRSENYSNFSLVNSSLEEDTNMEFTPVVKLALQVLVALFGVFGNLMVAIVFGRLRKRKTPADFYVQNLAIADLGTLLLAFPLSVIRMKIPWNWPFGKFSCLYMYPVPEAFYGASVWCIAVIAVERYRKIVVLRKPNLNGNKKSLKNAKIVVVCTWLMSFLVFSLPLNVVLEYHENQTGGKWCGTVWPSWLTAQVYVALLTLLSYILPLAVISWTYLAISRKLTRSSFFLKNLKRSQQGAQNNRLKSLRLRQNKRAKRILTPIVVVFAVTMLPVTILRLTFAFWPALAEQEYYEDLVYTATVFVILNSSANPVIYSIVSRHFRRGIKNIYHRVLRTNRSTHFSRIFQGSRTSSRRSRDHRGKQAFSLSPFMISKKSNPQSETN